MRSGNDRCVAECRGTVVRFWRNTMDTLGNIEVAYVVDGVEYRVVESLKARSEPIKLGPIPIGQRTYSVLKGVDVGSPVIVRYDPQVPSHAHLRDNCGIRNG